MKGLRKGEGESHAGKMTRSKEDYLKVILEFSDGKDMRSIDIANALGVSKASVSSMTGILRDEGYVTKQRYGAVALTEKGRRAAVDVKRRYELLKRFLHHVLGVEAATAAHDACRIEHLISAETAEQIDRRLRKRSEFRCDTELL
jgi:DtxR family Mn-dependent transcriptional regulator